MQKKKNHMIKCYASKWVQTKRSYMGFDLLQAAECVTIDRMCCHGFAGDNLGGSPPIKGVDEFSCVLMLACESFHSYLVCSLNNLHLSLQFII